MKAAAVTVLVRNFKDPATLQLILLLLLSRWRGHTLCQVAVLHIAQFYHLLCHHFVVVHRQKPVVLELVVQVSADLLRRAVHRR